tara:strand:+ start:645 stop:1157 length:513 start_codon:yes stop_codon:yes gene_type:complete
MERLNVICLGSLGCGKTSIITHMRDKRFGASKATMGVDYAMFQVGNVGVRCWDASGDPKFRRVTSVFVKDVDAVLYVYDVTSEDSLTEAEEWFYELKESHPTKIHVFVGNKCDLTDRYTTVPKILKEYPETMYFRVSAKSLSALTSLFRAVVNVAPPRREERRTQCCIIL